MLKLQAQKRQGVKNENNELRENGMIPAVFYGKKNESTAIAIPEIAFEKFLNDAGESTVVTISLDGQEVDALIHDVQFNPINDKPSHVDFYVFDKDVKVEVKIPVSFIGVSPAVKDKGGILVKVLHEIEVEALPKDLPHEIEVDISSLLEFDDVVLAKDLVMPTGVTLIEKLDEVVASVSGPKEEEEVDVPAPDLASVEVEKKGKKEEEGEVKAE